MRLGILTSHPIQYYAPWFRHLAKQMDVEVFYAHRQDAGGQGKAGFGVAFDWDVDLLSGYKHRFLKNVSKNPGLGTFAGCDTPELYDLIRRPRTTDNRITRPQDYEATSPDVSGQRSVVSGQSSCSRSFDAFLILGWNRKCYIQAIQACRRAGVPVLMRGDSQLRTPRSRLKSLLKYIPYRLLLPRLDAHLYVGQRNKEYLKHYGVSDEQLFFCPHFVDNEWFREKADIARKQRAEIRKRWEIPEDAFVALFVGKFISKKRPMDLVKALCVLNHQPSTINYHALFVGSGELGAQLRSSTNVVFDAEHPNPQPSTLNPQLPPASFVGFKNQTELPACYVAADVLVLPSNGEETWGLVVNEAMACGLPAIVSEAAGCAPDMIDEGQTGFSYPMGDVSELAGRLGKCNALVGTGNNQTGIFVQRKSRNYSMEFATEGLERAMGALTKSVGQSL